MTVAISGYSKPKHRIGPPNKYLFSLSKKNLDQSTQKMFNLILKTEALVAVRTIATEEKLNTGDVAFIPLKFL